MALNVVEKPYKIDINKDILLDSQKIFHHLINDSTKSEVKLEFYVLDWFSLNDIHSF